jgi:hypothetical protein
MKLKENQNFFGGFAEWSYFFRYVFTIWIVIIFGEML